MTLFSFKQLIFDNKKELMGLAIILIMCYHSELGENIKQFRLIYFVKELCDVGVDIFMMLSGFSLAVSLDNNNDLKIFFKKRIFRLLPSYLIVFSIWYAFLIMKDGGTLGQYFWNISFLNYYIDYDLIVWFVPVIFLYYLFIPFYVKTVSKYKVLRFFPYIIIILNILLLTFNINPRFTLLRLPIFLIGANMYLTSTNLDNITANIKFHLIFVAAILGAACSYYCMFIGEDVYAYKYIAYIPMTIYLVTLYRKSFCSGILCFFGLITFEIYLLHERIQWIFGAIQFKLCPQIPNMIICLMAIVVSIYAAYYLNKFVSKLVR